MPETATHEKTVTCDFLWTDLDCSCGVLAVSWLGGATGEEVDAKFAEHLADYQNEPEGDR